MNVPFHRIGMSPEYAARHQVLVSFPPVEELAVENTARKTVESYVLDIPNNQPQLPDLYAVAVAKDRNNDQTTLRNDHFR